MTCSQERRTEKGEKQLRENKLAESPEKAMTIVTRPSPFLMQTANPVRDTQPCLNIPKKRKIKMHPVHRIR